MVVGWTPNITSTKYEQTATLLRQGYSAKDPVITPTTPADDPSRPRYTGKFDPITGEILRDWEAPLVDSGKPDDPETDGVDESVREFTFECQARGVMTGGLNVRGAVERWTSKGNYDLTDAVEMHVAPNVLITTRDRVTNIRNSRGEIVWTEDTYGDTTPTVFDVSGVQPSLDPFGSLVEWFVLLHRSEIQGGREQGGG